MQRTVSQVAAAQIATLNVIYRSIFSLGHINTQRHNYRTYPLTSNTQKNDYQYAEMVSAALFLLLLLLLCTSKFCEMDLIGCFFLPLLFFIFIFLLWW